MTRSEVAPAKRKYPIPIILAPVLALVALFCWSISSPVGSSPDDDYHLASIWCGLGDRPGLCNEVASKPTERAVPAEAAKSPKCYRFHTDKSASCQAGYVKKSADLVATDRGNFDAGAYPPVYYWFMSLFAGASVTISAIVMRLVNSVLFVGLVSILYVLLPATRRQSLVWSWAITSVPLGAFLIASNNPSAWAIISGGTLWIALVGYFEAGGWRKVAFGAVSAAALVIGAGSRSDAAAYSVIAIVLAAILTVRRSRQYVLSLILPGALAIGAFCFYLSGRQSGVASGGFSAPANTLSKGALIWQNFMELPQLWSGSFGTSQLGWLDTPMPAMVWVLGIACFGGVVLVGLGALSTRKLIAGIGIAAALWAIPMWILLQSNTTVGNQLQARYLLPLLVFAAGIALYQSGARAIRFSTPQTVLVIAAVSVANAIALHVNLRRYTSGLNVVGINLDVQGGWWWNIPFSPMAIWIIGSLAFSAAVAIVLWRTRSSGVETPESERRLPVGRALAE